jgi:hypothetical protein
MRGYWGKIFPNKIEQRIFTANSCLNLINYIYA